MTRSLLGMADHLRSLGVTRVLRVTRDERVSVIAGERAWG
jgi:hypothetical protein